MFYIMRKVVKEILSKNFDPGSMHSFFLHSYLLAKVECAGPEIIA